MTYPGPSTLYPDEPPALPGHMFKYNWTPLWSLFYPNEPPALPTHMYKYNWTMPLMTTYPNPGPPFYHPNDDPNAAASVNPPSCQPQLRYHHHEDNYMVRHDPGLGVIGVLDPAFPVVLGKYVPSDV